MTPRQAISRARRTAFLAALEKSLSITGAAAAAGVNRTLLYKWRARLPAFAAAWDDAVMTAIDLLEDEALRRAVHGVERPVFYRGKQVGSVTTYNDRLLMLLLQRRSPRPQHINRPVPLRPADKRESVSLSAPGHLTQNNLPPEGEGARRAEGGCLHPLGVSPFTPCLLRHPPSGAGAPPSPSGGRPVSSGGDDRVSSEPRESVSFCLPAPDRQTSRAAAGTTAFQGRVNLSPSASLSPAVVPGAARNLFGPRGGGVSDPRESVSFCLSVTDCQVSRAAIEAAAFRDRANLSPSVSQGIWPSHGVFVVLSEAKDLAVVRPRTGSIGESPPPSFTDRTTAGSFASLRTTAKSVNLSPFVSPTAAAPG